MDKNVSILDFKKYYKQIIDNVPGSIIVFGIEDGMLQVRYISDNCEKISGFTPEETYKRSLISPVADVHPDDRGIFSVTAWDKTQNHLSFSYRIICKDGRYKWVRLELSKEEENGETMYYGLFSDIDEEHSKLELQKENERKLISLQTEMQHMYDNILDETRAMITVIDAETYKVVYANITAVQMANTQEDYIGCTCYKEIHHLDAPCEGCLLNKPKDSAPEVNEVDYLGRTYRMLRKIFMWNGKRALLEYSEDVTEQRRYNQAEKRLAEDKVKGGILLNAISGGVAMYHIMNDGTIQASYISEGLANIVGYTANEFLNKYGHNTKDCVYPEDLPIIASAIKKTLETGTTISNQYRLIKKDGTLITVNFDGQIIDSGSKLSGEVATLYAVQTLATDDSIREYKENKEHKRIFENIPGGIGLYDVYNGMATLEYLNDAYLNMMGIERNDREKYYGKDITAVVKEEDKPTVVAMINRIENGNNKDSATFRVQTGNGVWKWIHIDVSATKKSNRHYTGYAILSDFDDIINSQLKMEEARKKEETLISSIPGGIAIYRVKKNGKVATEYMSEKLAAMCGYTADEFLAYLKDDCLVNVADEDIPKVNAAVEKSLEDHKPVSIMYHICKKDKTQILIRLDANIIETEPLLSDEVAVFYAVHTLVSEESKKIIEEQKTFSLLLNSVPAGIGIYIIENGVIKQEYMNNFFFEMLSSTREERKKYSGLKVLDAVCADDISEISGAMNSIVKGASGAQADFRLTNGLGGWTWVHMTAAVSERKQGYIKVYTAFNDCTESKEHQLMLLRNERAVSLAQKQGDLSIWTYNIDRGVIIQQITSDEDGHMGYSIEVENVPDYFIESNSVHPDDVTQFMDAYNQLKDGTDKVDVTYRLLNQRTGLFNWVRMFYQRMENTADSDRIAVGFSMNVDRQQEAIERYKIEQALREQINANVLMYIEYNLTKDCYENNGKLLNLFEKNTWEGISSSDYIKGLTQAVEDIYVEEVETTLYSENLLKAFHKGENRVFVEYRSKQRPGMPSTWYRTSAKLVKRPDTEDIMAFIYVENIEKEKEHQLAIERSLADGIENIALISVPDGRARIIHDEYDGSNNDAKDIFLYDDDFVKCSHEAVISDERESDMHAGLLSTVIEKLKTADIYQFSLSIRDENKKIKRQFFRYRYLDDRKTHIVFTISDITDAYLIEQQKNEQLERALVETKKAGTAKADFYSRMSHDMRTPMNGILGMTVLSESENDIAVLHENMKKIHESGKYLLNLINDTLDVQRIESGRMVLEPQVANTIDMVENILDMIRGSAKAKGVNLKFNPGNADLDWYVLVDSLRVKQIFINLLSNAVKFTPAGGTVEFEFKMLKRDGMISHNVIYVRDTGVGMSKEFLENGIFKPFSQESNTVSTNYVGSGLGLSIAKSLVELMGGHIKVESKIGVGTTISVYLDFKRVDKSQAKDSLLDQKKQNDNVSACLHGKKILLVEDHPLNAEIAKKMLDKVGCVITWVQNGQEAVTCFENSDNNVFDAILMDIRMPVMDGLEATRLIRALTKKGSDSIPIIAMTANAYVDDIKAALSSGMNAHLAKPVDPQVLYRTLAEFLK